MLIHGTALVAFSQLFGAEHPGTASHVIQVTIVTPNISELAITVGSTAGQNKSESSIAGNSFRSAPTLAQKADGTEIEKNDSKKGTNPSLPYYFPSYLLDRVPVPISAPNPAEHLMSSAVPIIPIRLRLYIDAFGKVTNIDTLSVDINNEPLVESLKNMFYATSFIAGNRRGNDVASYVDIEVGLSEAER